MEIGLTYSSKDPRHLEARDFVRRFITEHGILANITEWDKEVKMPEITIDGCPICGAKLLGLGANKRNSRRFPSIDEIARALEQNFWSL